MSVLSFADVAVRYGKHDAVRGFSDEVGSGEWLGVIGPNGAGKSSLLRAVAGIAPARMTPGAFITRLPFAYDAAPRPGRWRHRHLHQPPATYRL